MVEYTCICCSFKTTHKSKHTKHLETNKHKRNEKENGDREASLEEQLVDAKKMIKQLADELADCKKVIHRQNKLLDKEDKDEINSGPRPVSKISTSFVADLIYPQTIDAFDDERNDLQDILNMDYGKIKKNIPIFETYMKCLVDSNLEPFGHFLRKHIHKNDYKIMEDNELFFYDDNGHETSASSLSLIRKTLAKQVKKCDELYRMYMNQFRRKDQHKHDMLMEQVNNKVDFQIFTKMLTSDQKAIKTDFIIEVLRT